MKVFAYYSVERVRLYADTTKGRKKLAEEIIINNSLKPKDELLNYKHLIMYNSPLLLNDKNINGFIKSYEVEG